MGKENKNSKTETITSFMFGDLPAAEVMRDQFEKRVLPGLPRGRNEELSVGLQDAGEEHNDLDGDSYYEVTIDVTQTFED